MDVGALRAQIPATGKYVYFNTGFSGPSPRPVVEAITRLLQMESEEGPTSPPVRTAVRAAAQDAREAFARLLGADPGEVVLTSNTTHGINLTLSGLSWKPGDEVITSDTEHPSGFIPLYYLRDREGVSLKFVHFDPLDGIAAILEKLEAAITPRTRLILLSHIMFTTGLRLPVPEIQKLVAGKGIQVLFDAAQSPGHVPLDMHGWGCDYFAIPGHKWMLGPSGTGALYIRSDLLPDVTPALVSSHAALSHDAAGHYEPNRNAPDKFDLTTPSGALLAGAAAAIGFLEKIGAGEIEQRWSGLTARLRSGLREIPGVSLVSPDGGPTACGMVTFTLDGWDHQPLVDVFFQRAGIVLRSVGSPPGVRVSSDFFNTEEEIDLVLDFVRTLLREGPPKQ